MPSTYVQERGQLVLLDLQTYFSCHMFGLKSRTALRGIR